MARRRRYQPIARIRRVLLLGLIIFVGVIAGYYMSGRLTPGGPAAESTHEDDDGGVRVRDGLLTVAHGFDYEVTDGEALAFRVKADRLVADVEDRMELDKVEVELPQEGGGVVVVEGDSGTIHLDSNSATLEGGVRARNSDGVVLNGESFEVIRDGRQLVSHSPVTFGKEGEFTGSARQLTYSLKRDRLILEGDVVIEGVSLNGSPAGAIRCETLIYDEEESLLRLEGNVRASRGLEFVRAGRLSISLGEDQREVRFVRAESGVKGRYLPEPAAGELASRVDFEGRLLYAVFEEGTRDAKQAELRGSARQAANLDLVDVSGLSRILTSPVLQAEFSRGEISYAEASNPVTVVERHSFAPGHLLRRICSERATVEFDALGEVELLTLAGNVDYQAVEMQATGDRMVARGTEGQVSIEGRPAVTTTARGDLQAPRITYLDSGSVVAEDGVRAAMREGSGTQLLGSESEEPVRVTADSARWDEEPESVAFTGSVRAWQGRDYLLADEMVGDPKTDRLTATGNVKSVFTPESNDDLLGDDTETVDEPITITAEELVYEQPESIVHYAGEAQAIQAERTLSCEAMDVELDADDEFERLVCTGELLIEDPTQGKTVRGEQAIYLPEADEVDVTGDPVILTDQDGTELRGGRILYRFDTGTARIRSRPLDESESETAEGSR